ncbi:Imm8 family immunity protein [Mesorhizobium sp. M0187]|uniref:Imm8 family immunity protein n=1 Tax=Mesorhizobium sp. M0187 TaxID=2956908 RepID=UPI00333C5352
MKAEYKGHRIVEADKLAFDLSTWRPSDPTDFSVTIDFYAGEEGKEGADAFTATVCSPTWFLRSHKEAVFSGESVIFMRTFDHLQLEKFLIARCASAEGNSWHEIAFELSRVGLWEFEYKL